MGMSQVKPPEFDDSNRYSEWTLLGKGGLGQTWLARDTRTGQNSVVKIRNNAYADPEAVRRRWSQVAHLNSPYVQRILDFLPQENNQSIIIHAHVPGVSLSERLAKGPLPQTEALRLIRDVLCGLMIVHQAGVVHRDVSPENIILSGNGAVLIDFDALGLLTEDSSIGATTIAGDFAGKTRYMSPEQFAAAPQSAAVDIWASGAVLYEALLGRPLHDHRNAAGLVATLGKPADITAAPSSLRPLLAGLLAPDPAARPTAKDAIARIDDLLAEPATPDLEPDPWIAMSAPAPSAAEPDRSHSQPQPAPPPAKTRKGWGRPLLVSFVIVFAVLALVVLGYFGGTFVDTGPVNELPSLPMMRPDPWHLALIFGGVLLAISSFFIARFLRASASQVEVALPFRALELINAPDAHDRLAETICLRIDAYREMAGRAAEDMLTVTMVALAKEYAEAETADERFRALAMLNELHGKVSSTLRPWWLQYERLIARALSLTTLVAGTVAAIEGVRGLF